MNDATLAQLRARMFRAAGLSPAAVLLAAGCAEVDGDSLATTEAARESQVLTSVVRGEQLTTPRADDLDRRQLRVGIPFNMVTDHVHWVDVAGAPPEAEILAELQADGESMVVSHGFADTSGDASLPVVLPDSDRLVYTTAVLLLTAVGPHGREVTGEASFVVQPAKTEFGELPLLQPALEASVDLAGGDYRACAPNLDGCVAPHDFHAWEGRQLAAYALDASLPPELDVVACEADAAPAEACCYTVNIGFKNGAAPTCPNDADDNWYYYGYSGRPFAGADGTPREAALTGVAWARPLDALPLPDDDALRAHVAEAWLRTARAEHASIASFARFQLELLALGAPADLLARAASAIADETRHAELAFAVASRLQGPVGPGALPLDDALARSTDPAAVLVGAIVEGCINETLAAALVRRAADHADPVLAPRLHTVADEEAQHAELAWGFVRWLLAERPELAPVARAAFDGFTLPEPAAPSSLDGRRWGVLDDAEADTLSAEVLDRIIRPCADALLATC